MCWLEKINLKEIKMRYLVFITIIGSIILSSCKKKFDEPPVKSPPAVSGYITIDSIFKKYKAYYVTASPKPTKLFKFENNVNLECIVTADETSGNIYKTAFVQDATGGLQVKLLNAGGLYVGDKIRINLNGVTLDDYGDMVQLDSVDIEKSVVKVNSGNPVVPVKVTFNQLLLLNGNGHTPFQSRLVVLDSVEFDLGSKDQFYADAVGKNSVDHLLINSDKKELILRSSGYANFASNKTPCGKGTMTVIVGQYNGDVQLTIRDFKEVKLASGGCPLLLSTFNKTDVFDGGWINYNVVGNVNWKSGNINGNYIQISNYFGSNVACETWLISPSVNLSSEASPRLVFKSAYNYSGPALQVLVSTNYSSGDPNAATWTALSPALSGGSWNWVRSGDVSLSAYKSANTRIAFKYTGTNTSGSTWEIDDVAIFGQ